MSDILSALAVANSLFAGFETHLTIGPVALSFNEIPSRLPFGGGQSLTVHKLIGGGRIIQAMGRDDMDLEWSGYFEGPTANIRAQQLDSLRQSGSAITLAWDVYSYTVVVSKFTANYERSNWIPYEITCTPVKDNSAPASTSLIGTLLEAQEDVSTAISAVKSFGI